MIALLVETLLFYYYADPMISTSKICNVRKTMSKSHFNVQIGEARMESWWGLGSESGTQ